MFYTKSPMNHKQKEQQIQPWNAQQSNMMNLIIESAEIQTKFSKNMGNNTIEEQKTSPNIATKEPHSYNFCTNLRKYEKKKVEEFSCKKDVNFIQKNIKGVSEDYIYFNESQPITLANKNLHDKYKKGKALELEYNSTIQPINWSLIMYYEENKCQKKYRHKDIQSFLRFQSQKIQKNSLRKPSMESKADSLEQNKYQGDKYQKLLKLREGLRRRNLKSASQSRKIIDNQLSIEQNNKMMKQNSTRKQVQIDKNFVRVLPKTSQSLRKTDATIKAQYTPQNSPKKSEFNDSRIIFTSHRNRINNSKKRKC